MTNEDYALLLDPERRQAGWWAKQIPNSCPHCNRPLNGTHVTPPAEDLIGGYRCLSCRVMHTSEFTFTGPDWHASDDACFRDWRPVLLAAGCYITEALSGTSIQDDAGVTMNVEETYRAATLAAIEELHTTKPELLREVIAEVPGEAVVRPEFVVQVQALDGDGFAALAEFVASEKARRAEGGGKV